MIERAYQASKDSIAASVIIPVFNGAFTISEQLDALGRQRSTYDANFEIVVCDNGSRDHTVAIVRQWARTASVPIRVLQATERSGPAHARNVGILGARGSVLAFCDADDIVADDWLLKMVRAVRPGLMVNGHSDRLGPDGSIPAAGDAADRLILRFGYLPGIESGNIAVLKNDILSIGGFDESFRYVEDVDLSWRFQQAGMSVGMAEGLLHIRVRQSAKGLFAQRRSWGKHGILLRVRHMSRAPMPMSITFSHVELAIQACLFPWRWVRADGEGRLRLLTSLGTALGELEGHWVYRVFRRVPEPILL